FYFSLFFQAEDGIRDFHVTGVQTCALPIFGIRIRILHRPIVAHQILKLITSALKGIQMRPVCRVEYLITPYPFEKNSKVHPFVRSEERRVGKEWAYRMSKAEYKG